MASARRGAQLARLRLPARPGVAGHPVRSRGRLRGGDCDPAGMADVVLIVTSEAGVYTERASTAPWTRPGHEFVIPWGMFTAAEFALIARRHMHMYGTTPEQLATVAATIRNNGHVNPEAVYLRPRAVHRRRTSSTSRMVADPFHLLDCSMTAEGGCALVLTTERHAPRSAPKPVCGARRQHRPLRPVVPAPAGVGPRRPLRRASHGRIGRAPRGEPRSRWPASGTTTSTCASSTTRSPSRSSASSRRSVSAAGRGRRLRRRRSHRAHRQPSRHDRRRADVLQPRRCQRADAAAGDPRRAADRAANASAARCRTRGSRWRRMRGAGALFHMVAVLGGVA